MSTISTKELRALLDRGDPVTLIMAMSGPAYSMGHIPGSTHATNAEGLDQLADRDTPIVVYCTGPDCAASGIAYRQMIAAGYRNVRHFAGGLVAWEAEGLPIETGEKTKVEENVKT